MGEYRYIDPQLHPQQQQKEGEGEEKFLELQVPKEEEKEDHQEEEEEEEEALSLCDLPLHNNNDNPNMSAISQVTTSTTTATSSSEFFEFFIGNFTTTPTSPQMSSAEDIIFRGKLLPFHQHNSKPISQQPSFRRRSGSLPGSFNRGSPDHPGLIMRTSRSLDDRKLVTSLRSDIDRNSSGKSAGRGKVAVRTTAAEAKPRWYVLMFGVLKPTTETELFKDIKSRQARRNPSTMIPPPEGKNNPVGRNSSKGGSGGLLRVLGCKGNASVAVATSYCVSQAQV